MAGIAVLLLLTAMACSWLARVFLLRKLCSAHPQTFAMLGQPSLRQLESILPRFNNTSLRFWQFLWGREVMRLGDPSVAALAWAARCSDITFACSVAAFLWAASQHA